MSEALNPRQERGYQIFKTKNIIEDTKGGWIVPSQSSGKKYHVDEEFVCDCPDSTNRGVTCKHAYASRYYLQIEQETPEGIKTEKVRLTYPQAWTAYNQAQTNEVRLFDELLKDLTVGIEEPNREGSGRKPLPMNEQAFCAIQKVYSQLSSRRANSLFHHAKNRDQINHAPHFNTISNFLAKESSTPILESLVGITARPLQSVETDFAVDSSGFRTTRFTQYCLQKHGGKKPYKWLKAHICVGVKTNIITSVTVTPGYSADSPQFDPLVTTTAESGFTTEEVSADMAYSSRDNLDLVDGLGGTGYIPFKSGSTGRSKGSPVWRKMVHYFKMHEDEFLSHYHKRSNVETTFHMIKTKLGDKLKSKMWVSQKNELLCKVIAHNIIVLIHEMFELGIEPNFSTCTKIEELAH